MSRYGQGSDGRATPRVSPLTSLFVRAALGGVLAGALCAASGASPFAATTNDLVVLTAPVELVAADFDGDGDVDFATLNAAGDLAWHERGSTGFTTDTIVAALTDPRRLSTVDLDCDGDQDLVLIEDGTDSLAWLENEGGGSWDGDTVISGRDLGDYSVADIDSDGSPDFAVTFPDDSTLEVLRNLGCDGVGWPTTTLSTTLASPRIVLAEELTGDAAVDIAVAEATTSELVLFENQGALPWTATTVATIPLLLRLESADFDLDGDNDLAALSETELAVWTAPANGSSWVRSEVSDEDFDGARLFIGDVNRDAQPEILAVDRLGSARGASDRLLLWQRIGTTADWQESTLIDGAAELGNLVLLDEDLDGALDLIVSDTAGDELSLLLNQGPHFAVSFPELLTVPFGFGLQSAMDLDVADLDGDGDLDVTVVDQDPTLVVGWTYWFENTTNSSNALSLTGPNFLHTISLATLDSLVLGDFDEDGSIDAFVAGAVTVAESASFCPNGAATPNVFWSCAIVDSGQHNNVRVHEAVDIDNDGDLDVLATVEEALTGDHYAIWWEQDGDPTLAASWMRQDIGSVSGMLTLRSGDLDRDGDLDVLASGGDWWESDGASPPAWTAGNVADLAGAPELHDLDRDGDLDAIAVRASSSGVDFAWFENDLDQTTPAWPGHAVWTPAPATAPGAAIAIGDLDLDGDVDLIGGTTDLTEPRLWFENPGTSATWTAHAVPGASLLARKLAAADFDRDGDLDLLALEGGASLTAHLNGAGQFLLAASSLRTAIAADTETALLQLELEHRGRSGDIDLVLASLPMIAGTDLVTPMSQAQWDARFTSLEVFLDDGSGAFAGASDTLLFSGSPTLTNGSFTINLPTDELDAHASVGAAVTLFVVLETTADAAELSPVDFALSLLDAEAVVLGADGSGPWRAEWSTPQQFEFVLDGTPLFADGFESGDTAAWSSTTP